MHKIKKFMIIKPELQAMLKRILDREGEEQKLPSQNTRRSTFLERHMWTKETRYGIGSIQHSK